MIINYDSYTEEKLFVAVSICYGCGYLLLLWNGVQNDVHCNCIILPKKEGYETMNLDSKNF